MSARFTFPSQSGLMRSRSRPQTDDLVPELGIVLGSGLGRLADELDEAVAIPFADLPGWPAASAPGHAGRLCSGPSRDCPWSASRVACTYTRGYSPRLVVEPVLLMGRLGAGARLLTNAAGGVNEASAGNADAHLRPHQHDRPCNRCSVRTTI